MYKEYLKHCLKRVHNILESGFYLSGNGEIEEFVAENIVQKLVYKKWDGDDDDEGGVYFGLAKEAFSVAFRELSLFIRRNDLSKENLLLNTSGSTFDDFQSKMEAWRVKDN